MGHEPQNGKATIQVAIQTLLLLGAALSAVITLYMKISALESKIEEIETQFRAVDEFRNVNLAGQMRFNALLWQKAYGETFPSEVYFPTISRK